MAADLPALPAGCPPAEAKSLSGTMYRLVNGGEEDWISHAAARGVNACPKSLSLCSWHALSVFAGLDQIRHLRRAVPRLRNHQVAKFTLDHNMGVAHLDNPDTTHHNWWPSPTFAPPPADHEILAEP